MRRASSRRSTARDRRHGRPGEHRGDCGDRPAAGAVGAAGGRPGGDGGAARTPPGRRGDGLPRRPGQPRPQPALRGRAPQHPGAREEPPAEHAHVRPTSTGPSRYSRRALAQEQDIPERLTAVYWRALGVTPVDADTVVLTDEDAHAIGDLAASVEDGVISGLAFASISRGMGFHMVRLAMWI